MSEPLKLSEIEENEWITPDMETTFILVETSKYSSKEGICVASEDARKVLKYREVDGAPPVAVVPQQVNKMPVLLATLGYEARGLPNSGIADILFVVDLGSTEEMDHLAIVKQAQEQDWIDIEDFFEIQSSELTLVSDIIGAPYWGKCSLTAKPGKYRVRYTLYSEDGPLLLFVRLDLIKT
jgi:hypothetical protein